jgi:hypothetical protein
MSLMNVLGALIFVMLIAYRGYSVILFAQWPHLAPSC